MNREEVEKVMLDEGCYMNEELLEKHRVKGTSKNDIFIFYDGDEDIVFQYIKAFQDQLNTLNMTSQVNIENEGFTNKHQIDNCFLTTDRRCLWTDLSRNQTDCYCIRLYKFPGTDLIEMIKNIHDKEIVSNDIMTTEYI